MASLGEWGWLLLACLAGAGRPRRGPGATCSRSRAVPVSTPRALRRAGPTDAGGAVTLKPVAGLPSRRGLAASEGGFLEEVVAGPGFGGWSWVAARPGRWSVVSNPARPY